MDITDKNRAAGFEKYGILVLVLTACGIFYWSTPLVPSRPPENAQPAPQNPGGKVRARLWQDPLETVIHAPDAAQAAAKRGAPALKKSTLVLPVYLTAGDTVSAKEQRLRTRYAILTALQTAGYIPESLEELYFFRLEKGWFSREDGPLWVPYEQLTKDPLRDAEKDEPEHILLLWLDGDPMYDQPLHRLAQIAGKIRTTDKNLKWQTASWRVIGPLDSDMLGTLLEELGKSKNAHSQWTDLRIFSPWATAATPIMKQMHSNGRFEELSSDRTRHVAKEAFVQRTIASDRELAELLVKELEARGVNLMADAKDNRVVLLSDWDTSYGRALPMTFAAAIQTMQTGKGFEENLQNLGDALNWPPQIRRVMYMRGLDGSRPHAEASAKSEPKKEGRPTASPDPNEIERAEGERQLDYARRIADQLVLEKDTGTVKAIGVLGSDVYDKLLLLQALRPRFPDAVFFTTDLDARLIHPGESRWARNVVVASSFGLDVPREFRDTPRDFEPTVGTLGRGLPPFRDNYQTASYFAVLRALGQVTRADIQAASKPWIYEIGRTRAHRLPADGIVYQTREMHEFSLTSTWLKVAAGLAFLFLLLLVQLLFGPQIWKNKGSWLIVGCLLGYIAAGAVVLVLAETRSGPPEPFTFIEGISIWPTEMIRFVAGLLAICFLIRVHQRIEQTNKSVQTSFLPEKNADSTGIQLNLWRHSLCHPAKEQAAQQATLENIWSEYKDGPAACRWVRVLLLCALYCLFGVCVFSVFGWPVVPYRGEGSKFVDRAVLVMSGVPQLLLIFYVVERMLMTERLVRHMVGGTETSPPTFLSGWRIGSDEPETRARLTIDLIARVTSTVSSLIVYPFVVLSLMIISSLSYFDRWDWRPSLIAVVGLSAVLALGSGWFLSWSAAQARKKIHEALHEFHFGASCNGQAAHAESISKAIGDIEKEERGAFAPLGTHPVLGAFALPSSTVVITLVLEYLERTA